ncbi:MAG TPA: nitroreductase, partial [Clostridiales bacterium]|nr:nitroreductase [Clostridiales bacterium]
MLHDLILKNRSYRRFDEGHHLTKEDLLPLIDAACLSPSAGNLQR